ncbi:MAG: hypothetical protein ACLP50_11685, partial [Solirubrobacteraceae bacterium]
RSGFRAHAATLSSPSRAKYAWALEHHLSELVDEQLRAIDVPRIVAHQHHLLETGRSPATVREVLIYLSGIMQVAAEHGLIPAKHCRSCGHYAGLTVPEAARRLRHSPALLIATYAHVIDGLQACGSTGSRS